MPKRKPSLPILRALNLLRMHPNVDQVMTSPDKIFEPHDRNVGSFSVIKRIDTRCVATFYDTNGHWDVFVFLKDAERWREPFEHIVHSLKPKTIPRIVPTFIKAKAKAKVEKQPPKEEAPKPVVIRRRAKVETPPETP
jgi:hypothetical protein